MRPGWILPSCTSRSIETRATSRLTGSKQEMTTVSGVSSMMTSTPVAASNARMLDRKSTRLNSSHANISYAVFCLKKTEEQLMDVPLNPHDILRVLGMERLQE